MLDGQARGDGAEDVRRVPETREQHQRRAVPAPFEVRQGDVAHPHDASMRGGVRLRTVELCHAPGYRTPGLRSKRRRGLAGRFIPRLDAPGTPHRLTPLGVRPATQST